jgi:hypothetical protein
MFSNTHTRAIKCPTNSDAWTHELSCGRWSPPDGSRWHRSAGHFFILGNNGDVVVTLSPFSISRGVCRIKFIHHFIITCIKKTTRVEHVPKLKQFQAMTLSTYWYNSFFFLYFKPWKREEQHFFFIIYSRRWWDYRWFRINIPMGVNKLNCWLVRERLVDGPSWPIVFKIHS